MACCLRPARSPPGWPGTGPLPPGPEEEKVSVVPVGIGPHVSLKQIRLIEKQASENKAFVLSGGARAGAADGRVSATSVTSPRGACLPRRPATSSHCAGHCGAAAPGPAPPGPRGALWSWMWHSSWKSSDGSRRRTSSRSAEFVEEVIRRMDVGRGRHPCHGAAVLVHGHRGALVRGHSPRRWSCSDSMKSATGVATQTNGAGPAVPVRAQLLRQPGGRAAPNLVYMVAGQPASDKISGCQETSSSCPLAWAPCGRAGAGEGQLASGPIFIQDMEAPVKGSGLVPAVAAPFHLALPGVMAGPGA